MAKAKPNTIAAIATPPGRGGIGVIRLSGPRAFDIAQEICSAAPAVGQVVLTDFTAQEGYTIDSGLVLAFKSPRSFTGEDVIELQGHGGPVVQDLLLAELIQRGAVMARPGEFSERAFLNNKIDLSQAEAIADLIDSGTKQAAIGAMRSLKGAFSQRVEELLEKLIFLRAYVEAAIDFPEEEIDFLADEVVSEKLNDLISAFSSCIAAAQQGAVLRAGLKLVLAGKPNAGKSSLLNYLAGHDAAIVTPIAGTTRDIVQQTIDIEGLPVHILDTAGLREATDEVEQIGVERARAAMQEADHILLLRDINDSETMPIEHPDKTTVVLTKHDLLEADSPKTEGAITISVKTEFGMDALRAHIKSIVGYQADHETVFTARRRHLHCLQNALDATLTGRAQLQQFQAGELLAEELLRAQNFVNEITGQFTSDDLLGKIFGSFCIGK